MKKNSGFTLLEILVVIGIITVLVSLGASSYTTAQKKSRDAKRKGDLKSIQSAFEQYYSVCGFAYPSPVDSDETRTPSILYCPSPSILIMQELPKDPKTDEYYSMTGDGTEYLISAELETVGSENTTYSLSNQQ